MATPDPSEDGSPSTVAYSPMVRAAGRGQGRATPVAEVSLASMVFIAGDGSRLEESLTSPTMERVSGRSVALPLMIAALVAIIGFGFAGRLSAGRAGASIDEPVPEHGAIHMVGGSAGERVARPGIEDVTPGASVADAVRADSLSTAEWEALYGPVAATWGVWAPPHSLSAAEWEALYGPVAATWGVWKSPDALSASPTGDRHGTPCHIQCPT